MSDVSPYPPNPEQSAIEQGYGALVISIWMQQFFCGILACYFRDYYKYPNKDSFFTKAIVAVLCALNILLFCCDIATLYRVGVLHYGVYDFFDLESWTMWSEPGITALIACTSQLFFLDRCRRVMEQWKWSHSALISVMTFLTSIILLSTGAGLATCISFWKVARFSAIGKIPIPITVWLITTTITDISLTAVLLAALLRKKSVYAKTDTVINRIIRLSMETSAATSCVAILNLLFYLCLQSTAYHLLPQLSISRIYTLTVLATLGARRELKENLDQNALYMSSIPTKTQNRVDEINIQVSTHVAEDGLSRGHSRKETNSWGTPGEATSDEVYTHGKV